MTTKTASRSFSSFSDLGEIYRKMTATPEFQAAFGDLDTVSIVEGERTTLDMPDPLDAQSSCGAIVATVFDLFRDTALEASASAIAWGIVNSFHHEAQKLERQEDDAAQQLGELVRDPDPSEIYAAQVEELQTKCQSLGGQRAAIECMRDFAAETYRAETGRPWSAARGSRASSASTASQIAAADFLKARAQESRERRNPTGPIVVVSGSADWHDWQQLWDRLDAIRARIPHMTLVTTAQRRGVDAIAAAWAAKHGVPLVGFTLMGRGASAAFKRNAQLAKLAPVEAIVCQGSGVQANLYQVLREARVPIHAFRFADQSPAQTVRAMTA